ncbi:hypothetical protein [Paratractidigestivibacter sp.]|uniref:hypothetical protein n=1 Tax=Paratractidigestivibacter sp. TaxID=2847316 RepID=UPI002ABD3AC3|nr:hypothetical protein [Paratractidigestivibacter sp.]
MISDAVIAPIKMRALTVSDVHFRLAEESVGDMKLDLGIDYKTSEPDNNGSDGVYALRANLELSATLANPEDETDIRLDSGINVLIEVAIDCPYFESAEGARDYLATNALSMAYSHARSVLMTIAGMTPASNFILPPIIPSAFKAQG